MVKPDVIIGYFDKNFDLNELMGFTDGRMKASEESSSMDTTDFLANMSTFLFILLLIISGVIFMVFLTLVCKKSIADNIKAKIVKFKNDTFFGNSIKA